MKLTDRQLKGLKPKKSAYRIYESGIDKGFGVKVTPAGSVSFFVQYASGGKQRFYNLGRYPSVSLAEARKLCRETREIIDRGIDTQDPAIEFGTVENLLNYYINELRSSGKRTWKKVEADLMYNCKPIIAMQANEITPNHIKTFWPLSYNEAQKYRLIESGHT